MIMKTYIMIISRFACFQGWEFRLPQYQNKSSWLSQAQDSGVRSGAEVIMVEMVPSVYSELKIA